MRQVHATTTLKSTEGQESFQVLLEVTYANGRIRTVRDVSEEAQDYFDGQLGEEFVQSEISKYQDASSMQMEAKEVVQGPE
jgi:hypothetical protein